MYLIHTCRDCEFAATRAHQKAKPEMWRALNAKYYQVVSEGRVSRRNVSNRSEEDKAQRARDKANKRCTRAKQARIDDEFSNFVTQEAHHLRQLRDSLTNCLWHVDHIVPLKGKTVSGLHVWNNLQVIPKTENLKKGNKYAVYEDSQWKISKGL